MPFLPPVNYSFALSETAIKKHLPKLSEASNFEFTSPKTDDYNCVAWALASEDEWIQFQDENGEWDIRLTRYIAYFRSNGFVESTNTQPIEGVIRIALYADEKTNEFTHIARQLPDGKWTSKLGEWEDITHNSLEVLAGGFYGVPIVLMERKIE